jgi:carbon storage regulator CsrA
MLVLTRKAGESITVTTPSGETLTVQVFLDRHGRVRIGIKAPKDYHVIRTELKEKNDDQIRSAR